MQSDRFREYSCFIEVVKLGSFTLAADRLGVSKSHVSKTVAGLEERLGVALLQRTTRRVRVTEAGLDYYDKVLPIIRAADLIDAGVKTGGNNADVMGTVRITLSTSFYLEDISRRMSGLMRDYPNLTLQFMVSDRQISIDHGEVDIAIRLRESETIRENSVTVGTSEMVLVAAPQYLQSHGAPTSVEDLLQHNLLSYSLRRSGNFWTVYTKDGKSQRMRADGTVIADNGHALCALAEEGIGIAYLPDFVIGEAVAKKRLQRLGDPFSTAPLYVNIVVSPQTKSTRAVNTVYQFLQSDVFADLWR